MREKIWHLEALIVLINNARARANIMPHVPQYTRDAVNVPTQRGLTG